MAAGLAGAVIPQFIHMGFEKNLANAQLRAAQAARATATSGQYISPLTFMKPALCAQASWQRHSWHSFQQRGAVRSVMVAGENNIQQNYSTKDSAEDNPHAFLTSGRLWRRVDISSCNMCLFP
jgi:hypothetical protein